MWEVVHLHMKCYRFDQVSEHELHVPFHKNRASFQHAEYNSPVKNITEQEALRESRHAREGSDETEPFYQIVCHLGMPEEYPGNCFKLPAASFLMRVG